MRRPEHLLAAVVVGGAVVAAASAAMAADYPARTIEIVIPYGPGGSTDTVGRPLAHALEQRLKQPVVIVNRPGASGTIGVGSAARAEPDGYTLLLSYTTELAVMPQLSPGSVHYSLDDFVPIAVTGLVPLLLLGANTLPADTLPQLIEAIRRAPGKYTYGGGFGSPSHISGAWLSRLLHLDLVHVPYKGGAQGVGDVIGSHLDLFFPGTAAGKSAIDGHLAKGFAITGDTRSPALPQIPTFQEAGVSDFDLSAWTMLLAPKGTPAPIVKFLQQAVSATLADPALQAQLAREGVEPTHEDAAAFLAREHDKFARLIRETGIRMEQ